MSGKIRAGIVVLLVVGALTMALTATAFAQEQTPERVPAPFGMRGLGHAIGGEVGLEAAAEALGMTADELSTQLWGGKTLSDLADEAGVDLAVVRDAVTAAVTAAREQAQRDAIEQAVEDGNLTREHADWLLEGLDKGFLGGHGFGGFGMRGGFAGPGTFGGFRFSAPSTNGSDA